jgi:membrane-associated protein
LPLAAPSRFCHGHRFAAARMHAIIDFVRNLYNSGYLQQMIHAHGIPLLALVVFAETGLLIGFFLPGDTMLFIAGVAAATVDPLGHAYLNIYALTASLVAAAIIGDQVGYFLGLQTGHAIFARKERFFFKRKHAEKAHAFYMKYGAWAVIAGRFMPIFRTFVPFMAGVGEMPYLKYLAIDSIGGFLWITIVVWSGYLLGERAQHNLHYIIPAIALISLLPAIVGVTKEILLARKNAAS